jgi:hypothetical protein
MSARRKPVVVLWKRCRGSFAAARSGGSCHGNSGIGTACSSGSADGVNRASGKLCIGIRCNIPICSMFSWIVRWFGRMPVRRGQKTARPIKKRWVDRAAASARKFTPSSMRWATLWTRSFYKQKSKLKDSFGKASHFIGNSRQAMGILPAVMAIKMLTKKLTKRPKTAQKSGRFQTIVLP